MKELMVTPYAPYRDGIASYSVQEVRSKIAEGAFVEVVSPKPSAAQHNLELGNSTGLRGLAELAEEFDQITVQFYPELLFGTTRNRIGRILVWHRLQKLASSKPVELRVHEITYSSFERSRLERRAAQRVMNSAAAIRVHTKAEKKLLVEALDLDSATVDLVEHGQYFEPIAKLGKRQAREYLNLPQDKKIFACLGFIQAHKGFDKAIAAHSCLDGDGSALYIVGSSRVDAPDLVAYADLLGELAADNPGVEYRRQFLSDYDFDAWLIAADCVVLPYREIWSSGVLERAKLIGTPVIVSAVGGLADQATKNTIVCDSEIQLVKAMASVSEIELVGDNSEK